MSQLGSQAVAVTSPANSMAAVAWKGAPSGRGYMQIYSLNIKRVS